MVCCGPKRRYVACDLFLEMDPAVLGHPCASESMCHVFVCFAVRVTSAGTTGGDKRTTVIFNHGLAVSLWNREEA